MDDVIVESRIVQRGFRLICRVIAQDGRLKGFEMVSPVPYKTAAAFQRDYREDFERGVGEAAAELESEKPPAPVPGQILLKTPPPAGQAVLVPYTSRSDS